VLDRFKNAGYGTRLIKIIDLGDLELIPLLFNKGIRMFYDDVIPV
jgi:hypothetical protein